MKQVSPLLPRVLSLLLAIISTLALIFLIWQEQRIDRPEKLYLTTSGKVEMCFGCHSGEKAEHLDPAHDARVLGCSSCHLGEPLEITKDSAHEGMVRNPGDLRHVEKTCSSAGCHPEDAHKVKNSLMATNRGILGTLLYYWGESESQDSELTVEELLQSGKTSLALDYYRKLCATCHLWKQKNDLPGVSEFFNEKGGGCTACHYHLPEASTDKGLFSVASDKSWEDGKKPHPLITKKVSSVNCIRCHNRSGRIGLAYKGIFESEGYGTPYEKGGLSEKQLPGARFYLELADDIHHRQSMECIDCHTRNEVMGDGTSYAHYEEQLEISCTGCHSAGGGITRKNEPLTNFIRKEDGSYLKGKVDEKLRPIKMPKKGVCDFPAHGRVSCEACHSTWVAQCFGCHVRRDERQKHLDKLSLEETPGRWEEGRSYIRYEKPVLGVWADEIVIVTPGCQDIVTVVDEKGELETSFDRFTMAAINPHTTQAKGRGCLDCHASTKTLGLGEGRLVMEDNQLFFKANEKGITTLSGTNPPLDNWVRLNGEPLQHSSRADLRPFSGGELAAILRVGFCVRCHDSYNDPVWKDYSHTTRCAVPEGRQQGDLLLMGQLQGERQ